MVEIVDWKTLGDEHYYWDEGSEFFFDLGVAIEYIEEYVQDNEGVKLPELLYICKTRTLKYNALDLVDYLAVEMCWKGFEDGAIPHEKHIEKLQNFLDDWIKESECYSYVIPDMSKAIKTEGLWSST